MNSVLIIVSCLFAFLFFHPKVRKSIFWRATVTPLASIIGSGFLVAAPILAHAAGNYAWMAMTALCALAYLFGSAIRHNIAHIEDELSEHPAALTAGLERASDFALSLAYFVSVAYYLNLFAAFGLRFGDIVEPFWIRIAATAVIACVGTLGALGGLRALERLEVSVVGVKLSLIGGLCVTLAIAGVFAFVSGTLHWNPPDHAHGINEIRILLGLVILVQGFETSRYLGDAYDKETRIKTMRWSQWIASGIYFAFIILVTPYFTQELPALGGETAIIDMLIPVGAVVAPAIIIVALASQLSAAVADMNGAGGLLFETTNKRLSPEAGHLLTALLAVAITWVADIYEIITYASKLFVLYYALQSVQADCSAWRLKRYGRAAMYSAGVAVALLVVMFAIPADV